MNLYNCLEDMSVDEMGNVIVQLEGAVVIFDTEYVLRAVSL